MQIHTMKATKIIQRDEALYDLVLSKKLPVPFPDWIAPADETPNPAESPVDLVT